MKAFFNLQTKSVSFAALLLGASALVSRLLGLVRDRLLASRFGAGSDLDIYFAAFRIPDFVYGILIMGGLSAVFIPVFAEYFKKDETEGWRLVSVILNCFLILLIVLSAILAVLTPWLIKLVAPGFNPSQKDLAILLTRIMFLSPVFFGLSSIFSGILHYFNRFLAYSFAPVFYNLGIIGGILFFVPVWGLKGLAFGVILGAFAHWLVQVPAARASGFRYFAAFNFRYPGLIKIFKFMSFRVLGASVYHINLIVITAIASTLALGSITIFNFAHHLFYFPLGIIGASFATAAFPFLSRAWASDRKEEFLKGLSSVFRQVLFLAVPVSFLMFLLRTQIVGIILSAGRFGWLETQLTAASLGVFCLAIFAFALLPFVLRIFFSFQDVKTPTLIGLFYMVLTAVASFSFVWLLGFPNIFRKFLLGFLGLQEIENIQVLGLPLAVSLSGIIYFFLLVIFLKKRLGQMRLKEVGRSLGRVLLASLIMAWGVNLILESAEGVVLQTALAALGGVLIYLPAVYFLGSPEIKIIFQRRTKS